jgi:hypothetical protein
VERATLKWEKLSAARDERDGEEMAGVRRTTVR